MLSIKEFLLIAALVCFVVFLVMFSLRENRVRGISELLLANVLGAFAFLLYAFGRELPPLIAYEAANGLYAAAGLAALVGFRRLFNRPVSMPIIVAILVLFTGAIAIYHYGWYSHSARTIIVSILQAGVALVIAYTVLLARKGWRSSCYPLLFTAGACGAMATGHIARGVIHLRGTDVPTSLLQAVEWNVFILASGTVLFPVLTLGGLLIAHCAIVTLSENAANRDFLTGAWSRRAFFELGDRELARCQRTNRGLALLLIDLDDFKSINDTFGHAVGDQALIDMVRRANNGIRGIDHLSRIGGDEFALLLPETDLKGACIAAERLKQQLETSDKESDSPCMTFSVGVSVLRADDCLQTLLKRADAALYEAKLAGRNCIATECPESGSRATLVPLGRTAS